jgi:hypothetical protein
VAARRLALEVAQLLDLGLSRRRPSARAASRSKRRKYSSLTMASTKISKAITCTCGPRATISRSSPTARTRMKSRWKRKMRRKSTKSLLMKRSDR